MGRARKREGKGATRRGERKGGEATATPYPGRAATPLEGVSLRVATRLAAGWECEEERSEEDALHGAVGAPLRRRLWGRVTAAIEDIGNDVLVTAVTKDIGSPEKEITPAAPEDPMANCGSQIARRGPNELHNLPWRTGGWGGGPSAAPSPKSAVQSRCPACGWQPPQASAGRPVGWLGLPVALSGPEARD